MAVERSGVAGRTLCPWCGAEARDWDGKCPSCGRFFTRQRAWLDDQQRRQRRQLLRRLALGTTAALLLAVAFWINYAFLPNPFTLLFKRPATSISSNSPPGQWAMLGRDLQLTRYVNQAVNPPQGSVVWSIQPGESTRAAPSIADGVIYLAGHFNIMALDATTGDLIWQRDATGPVQTSPAVAGDLLYLGLLDHRVLALERNSGEIRWQFRAEDGITAAPVVHRGMVYVGSWDTFIYALDAAHGRLLWKHQTQGQVRFSPAARGDRLYVTDTNGNLHILNARTGQSFLRFRVPPTTSGSPVLAGNLALFPSGGQVYAVDAGARELPGEFRFKQVWAQFWIWQVPGVPRPPGQRGGQWRISAEGEGGFAVSPAVAPDALYIADTRGNLSARDVVTGHELWRVQKPGIPVGSPLVVGEEVYFGVENTLYALERATGRTVWQLSLESPLEAPLVYADGRIYARTAAGWVYAIE
jgi:eukaryotic-like serine/threonine-protein kinase